MAAWTKHLAIMVLQPFNQLSSFLRQPVEVSRWNLTAESSSPLDITTAEPCASSHACSRMGSLTQLSVRMAHRPLSAAIRSRFCLMATSSSAPAALHQRMLRTALLLKISVFMVRLRVSRMKQADLLLLTTLQLLRGSLLPGPFLLI